MRYIFLILTIAAFAAHAIVLSPMLEGHQSSVADEINLAIWIFIVGVLLLELYMLPRRPKVEADPEQVAKEQALAHARAIAYMDRITREAEGDSATSKHMADALAYGLSAHRISMDPGADECQFVAIPFADLIKHAEAHRATEAELSTRRAQRWAKLKEHLESGAVTMPPAWPADGFDLAKPGTDSTVIASVKRQGHGGARKRAKEARTAARAPAAWPAMGAAA